MSFCGSTTRSPWESTDKAGWLPLWFLVQTDTRTSTSISPIKCHAATAKQEVNVCAGSGKPTPVQRFPSPPATSVSPLILSPLCFWKKGANVHQRTITFVFDIFTQQTGTRGALVSMKLLCTRKKCFTISQCPTGPVREESDHVRVS